MRQSVPSHRYLSVSFMLLFVMLIFACDNQEAVAKSKRGFLGVTVEEMTPTMLKEMNIGSRSGLLITKVIHRSPADDAGIREDDVIIKYDGNAVDVIDDFILLVRNSAPESSVKIEVVRDGEEKQFEVTIDRKRRNRWSHSFPGGNGAAVFAFGRPQMGVQVHELSEELSAYFNGVESGVLVLAVNEDSPAEKAGFKAGDVITKIDEEAVETPADLIDLLSDYEDGEEATVEYVRQGKTATATVTLEDGHKFSNSFFHRFAPDVDDITRHYKRNAPEVKILRHYSDGYTEI